MPTERATILRALNLKKWHRLYVCFSRQRGWKSFYPEFFDEEG